MDLQYTIINGRKIIGLPPFLEALNKAHEELKAQGIGYGKTLGLVTAGEETCSWRSLALQKQLVARGASKTLDSNHRRGTACDVAADWDYIKRIATTMKKHGLINDLAYAKYSAGKIIATSSVQLAGYTAWDGGHFNWQSNSKAASFPIIDVAPALLKEFSMQDYNEHLIQITEPGVTDTGTFALVIGGKKRIVSKDRKADASLTVLMRGMKSAGVTKKDWDAIPTGEAF